MPPIEIRKEVLFDAAELPADEEQAQAARDAGHPLPVADPRHRPLRQDIDDAEQGFARTAARPRPGGAPPPSDPDDGPSVVGPEVLQRGTEELSDLGNAEWFAAQHGDDVRHVIFGDSGRWHVYDGRRYAPDRARVEQLSQKTARSIWSRYSGCQDEQTLRQARRVQSANGLAAMLRTAEALRAIDADAFDRDPYLFNVANGTIDLRTGTLRPHRREDLLTKLSPVAFDPRAECPRWRAFLEEVQPDPEVRALLQRLVGYSLIGTVAEHLLVINFGNGGNGKGTFMETGLEVFGEYGVAVPAELLMVKRGDAHPTERTVLFGARLASAQESEEACKLNVALVKTLTGGDTIRARRMREDFWEFKPTHQLWLSTNHKPEIAETKDAIWRRVLLIPWTVQPATVDPHLKDKLRAEAPGILAWAVEGARLYQKQGIAAPASVVAAGAAYRAQQDVLGAFLRERCVLHEAAKVTKSELLAAYKRWVAASGEDDDAILAAKVFAEKIREHGCEDVSSMRSGPSAGPERGWRGIRLKTGNERAADAMAAEQATETADAMN